MRHKSILAILLFAAASASGQSLDATMNKGDTKTFTATFSYSVQTFTAGTPMVVLVTASPSLTLGQTTVTGFACPIQTPNVNQCLGTMSASAGTQTLTVTQVLSVRSDASATSSSWTIQVIGAGLSGLSPKTGVITITSPTPKVVLVSAPRGLIRGPGERASGDLVTIKNIGDGSADVVANNANGTAVFTILSRGSFTLAPGASTSFPIDEDPSTAPSRDGGGFFTDDLQITGTGVDPVLHHIGLILRVRNRPTTPPSVQPEKNRADVSGSASGAKPNVIVTFTNNGTGAAEGVVTADDPSVTVANPQLTLNAGESKAVTASVDLAAIALTGVSSNIASLVFRYMLPASGKTGATRVSPLADPPGTGSVSVTLVSTVTPTVSPATIPPLTGIHDQTFLAGVGHAQGSVGLFISDLTIFPQVIRSNPNFRNLSLPTMDLYYIPLGGGSALKATLASLSPPNLAAFGDLVGTVYGANAQIGSIQIRTPGYLGDGAVGVNANVFNVSGKTGTYGTSVPVFKFGEFECSQDASKKLYLTGLRKDATGHTNFYIQETCGTAGKVNLDFYDANGNKVGNTTADVPAFAATQLGASALPTGAVSAVLSHVAGTGGGFVAYATPVDELSGDTWAQVDWPNQRGYKGSDPVIIPVAGATPGANNTYFRTDLAIMNTGSASGSGTLRFINRTGETIDKTITLDALHTNTYSDVTTNLFGVTTPHVGYLKFTPTSGTFVLTSRNYSTPVGSNATFGTAVPTLPLSASLGSLQGPGDVRRIGGVEDASPDTVGAGRGATFRTNFGLIETNGQAVTVKVTVFFSYPASSLTQALVSASQTFNLTPNQFLLQGIGTLFGSSRPNIDLHNATIEFEVVSGTGKVIPFVSSVDNGTGDSTFRSE